MQIAIRNSMEGAKADGRTAMRRLLCGSEFERETGAPATCSFAMAILLFQPFSGFIRGHAAGPACKCAFVLRNCKWKPAEALREIKK